jgi:hypothetical protein
MVDWEFMAGVFAWLDYARDLFDEMGFPFIALLTVAVLARISIVLVKWFSARKLGG